MPTIQQLAERIPLTSLGRSAVMASVVAYSLAWQFGWSELMVFTAVLVLALLTAVPFVVGRKRLDVRRTIQPRRVAVGEPAISSLTVSNPTRTPVASLVLEDHFGGRAVTVDISGLRPSASIESIHPLPTGQRGVLDVGPAVVAKADPLGLMRRHVQQADTDRLWVHPRILALQSVPLGFARDMDGPTSDASPAGDVSFHALRDYELGDDHRHVHWLSTAKTGELMVRHYVDNRLPVPTIVLDHAADQYSPTQDPATLDLDQEPPPSSFETAVEIAASLSVSSLRQRQSIAFHFGDRSLASHRVLADGETLLDDLTLVTARGDLPLLTQMAQATTSEPDTSVVVIITGPRKAEELLAVVGQAGPGRHPIIVRVLGDPGERTPTYVPGATTFDVASLEEFRAAWDRVMT